MNAVRICTLSAALLLVFATRGVLSSETTDQRQSGQGQSGQQDAALAVADAESTGHGNAASQVRELLARGQLDEARRQAEAALDQSDNDARAWFAVCQVRQASAQPDAATLACERALSLQPDIAVSTQALRARIALDVGDISAASAAARHALTAFDQLRDAPPGPEVIMDAASASVVLGRNNTTRLRDAVELLRDGVIAHPEHVGLRLALAELLLSKYNNAEASEWFQAAAKLEPEHPRAMLGIARSLEFDNLSTAADAIDALNERHPRYVPGLVMRAGLQMDAEDYPAARKTLAEALVVQPHNAPALAYWAGIEYLTGNFPGARQVISDVRSRTPGNARIYETIAELAERNRRYRDAVQFSELALRVDRARWSAYAILGINRTRIGQVAAGRQALEIAFANDPFNVRVKNTLDLMDRVNAEYERRRSEHFVLLAHQSEASALAALALPLAEQAYAFYRERYQHASSTPIVLEFYPRHEDFSVRTSGVVGLGILGVSFGRVIAMDSPSAGAFGPLNWGSVLWHEIAHSFHLSMTNHRMPRWFSEGLAVYEERRARTGWGADLTPSFVRAYMKGELPVASRMNETFLRPGSATALVNGYFQASMFIEFVVNRAGFEAVRGILEGFDRNLPFNQVARAVLKLDTAAMDAGFQTFLDSRVASAKAALGDGDGDDSAYESLLAKAASFREAGNDPEARATLLQAIQLAPDFADKDSAYWQLAAIEAKAGDHSAAASTLEAMLAVNADSLDGHAMLARSYRELTNSSRERQTLERALYIQPLDPRIHQRLGKLYEDESLWFEAAQAYEALLSLAPPDGADANFRYARALLKAGAPDRARVAVLRALERAPMYDEALELLLEIREARETKP